jgi:hypothetical protein
LGGGGGGLRGVVYCGDDTRFVATCICMPSQGEILQQQKIAHRGAEFNVL